MKLYGRLYPEDTKLSKFDLFWLVPNWDKIPETKEDENGPKLKDSDDMVNNYYC